MRCRAQGRRSCFSARCGGDGCGCPSQQADQRSRYSVGTWDENCESRRIRENRDTEAGCV
ncbi:hypothetical protein BGY98DRAFT_963703, partial [Russula aff. rugulosa BPL654]